MKYIIEKVLICLSILFLCCAVNAQEQSNSSISPPKDDEWECGLTSPPLIKLDVTVWSSKKDYLNDLTYKDFEVRDEKGKLQDIEFFNFDELENHYTIGFSQKYPQQGVKWQDIKVKVKFSKEKKKNFGETTITVQKGYISKES